MRKVLSVVVISMVSFWSVGAQAQLGGLGGLVGKKSEPNKAGTENLGARADQFAADAAEFRIAVAYSLIQIVGAVGDKNQIALAKQSRDSVKADTNPRENAARVGKVIKDLSAVAATQLDGAAAQQKVKKLTPEMQLKVADALLNLGIASLKLPGLAENGQEILQGLSSNPMANMSKIGPLRDGLSMLAATAPDLPKIASLSAKLLSTVKVNAPTPTAGTKFKVDPNPSIPDE